MRMWMVDPRALCRNHLLGEHKELHMLLGSLSIKTSIRGYTERRFLEPRAVVRRHRELVKEMKHRGWTGHTTPLATAPIGHLPRDVRDTTVDVEESYRELRRRCPACAERIMDLAISLGCLPTELGSAEDNNHRLTGGKA